MARNFLGIEQWSRLWKKVTNAVDVGDDKLLGCPRNLVNGL